jgi:predicted NAD/FAD-binding protein
VDTGFLVYNDRTYPNLIKLFAELGVESASPRCRFRSRATMSPTAAPRMERLQPATVFAQRGNLADPRFLGMLRDLLRFNPSPAAWPKRHRGAAGPAARRFLDAHRFGAEFRDWYFLPMMACIWSCPTAQMLQFPVATMIRFCHNHGLLQITNRPQWWTVRGGARHYVEKIIAGIADKRLNTPVRPNTSPRRTAKAACSSHTDAGTERFDKVILATHSDQSLPCWRARRTESAPCWAPSATSPTTPCCTPTPRCCRCARRPGRPGTTSARRRRQEARRASACTTC